MKRVLLALWMPAVAAAEPRPLFDGMSLRGWAHEGAATFRAAGGVLRTDGKAHEGNWLRSENEFEDFRLRFEYKLDQWAEAAVFLRAPRTARPHHAGVTIFLGHDFHKKPSPWTTGAVAGALAPQKWPGESWGVWHAMEAELRGSRLRVKIDGSLVQETDLDAIPATAARLRRGYIGFADQGYGWEIRKVEIEDFGSPMKFVDLLASGTLDGWQRRGESGQWRLRDGVLEGADGHSILYAPQVFDDFEFTACVRSHGRTNSGVFVRGQPAGAWRGFEIQIYSPVDAVYPTGSIYGKVRSSYDADLEGKWFLLQIRVVGNRVDVWLDGRHIAGYGGLSGDESKAGRIGFQIHLEKTRVEFRDVRVRPIPQPAAGSGL
ncbi:MAG: DUF1080 domain-containing protein [Bryobacteraceae bacterium]|nr:DUF1080 domain-containing protein [Bryobacteraceae bacterium]